MRDAADSLWGRKSVPGFSQLKSHEIALANILKSQRDPQTRRQRLGRAVTAGMTVRESAVYLRCSRRSVRETHYSARFCDSDIYLDGDKVDKGKVSAVDVEQKKILVDFFKNDVTLVASGTAKSETGGLHRMEMRIGEATSKWYACYPKLLRDFAELNPSYCLENNTPFATHVKAAVGAARAPEFDAGVEYDERFKIANEKSKRKLNAARARRRKNSGYAPAWKKPAGNETSPATKAFHDKIKPVGTRQFFRIIDEAKIRWTDKTYIHPCDICAKGPSELAARDAAVAAMADLTNRIAKMPEGPEKKAALQKYKDQAAGVEKREKKIRKYKMHLD